MISVLEVNEEFVVVVVEDNIVVLVVVVEKIVDFLGVGEVC